MRFIAVVLVAVTSVLTAFSPAHASATDDVGYVNQMIDGVSLPIFIQTADSPWRDSRFDWSTDLCSAPLIGSTGRSFDFTNPCRRHDFGYRNLKLIESRSGLDAWNSSSKLRVDQRFLADMRAHCDSRGWLTRSSCRAWALTFYYAVRQFG